MRNKIIFLIILSIAMLFFISKINFQSRLPIANSAAIAESKSISTDRDAYNKTVKALHEGWENIRLGNSYDDAGRYEDAIVAYKKAYEIDPGTRPLSGKKLVEIYEKLSRYDEAIAVVDEILRTRKLAEYGVQKWTAMRARLLAAKEAGNQSK